MKRIWKLIVVFGIMVIAFLTFDTQAKERVSVSHYQTTGKTSFVRIKPKLRKKYYKWEKAEGDICYFRDVRIGWNKVPDASSYQVWMKVPDVGDYWWKAFSVKKNGKRYFFEIQCDYGNYKVPWGQDVYYKVRAVREVRGRRQYTRWSNIVHIVYDYNI